MIGLVSVGEAGRRRGVSESLPLPTAAAVGDVFVLVATIVTGDVELELRNSIILR